MDDPQLLRWQAQWADAKAQLTAPGPMRSGSLSRQYRDPARKTGAFWQLSYTHDMRSRSRHVRAEELATSSLSSPPSNAFANSSWTTAE